LKNKKTAGDGLDAGFDELSKDTIVNGSKSKKQKLVRFEEPKVARQMPKTKFLRFSNKKKTMQNSNK
jgi:hypothetical protein